MGETSSFRSISVHHVDIVVDVNIAYIFSREGYLFAVRRPGGFIFYDILVLVRLDRPVPSEFIT